MYTPTPRTCSYKLNETVWNVLQNEDEHRLLDSADTKYDALIKWTDMPKIVFN